MIYALLALLIIFTISSPKLIVTKMVLTIVALIAFAFWYISDMFTGNGVNDAVFYHILNSSEGASLDDLVPKIKIAVLFIVVILLLITSCAFIKIKNKKSLFIKYASILFFLTLILILASPFSINIYNSTKESFFSKGNPNEVKNEYTIPIKNLNKKYNYVFIYGESLERSFRDLDGKNYLPELSAIADNYADFTNIIQPLNRGFGWTMAGMVNTQCGIPLVMEQGNAGANVSEFLSKAQCVTSWLTDQGYDTEFIRGSQKEFAGGNKFFAQHGWKRQDDLSYFVKNGLANPEQISSWGVHDDALLNHVGMEFDRLTKNQQPFVLSFLTVNTHSPDGLFLSACENHVEKDANLAMLSAVKCSDFLLSKFINKIINSPAFDNTIIVLVSDHLMMENDASALLKKNQNLRRNNFIVIKKGLTPSKNNTNGSLLDVWPTVLDIAGSPDKQLGFGRSLLGNQESKFITDYRSGKASDYLAFASDLWGATSIKTGMTQIVNKLKIGTQEFTLPVYAAVNNNKLGPLWFEAFAKNIFKITKNNQPFFYANLCKNIGIDANAICAYIVSPEKITKLRITPQGITASNKNDIKTIFYSKKIKGLSSGPYFMDSGYSTNNSNNSFPSGINFLSPINSSLKISLSYQTCANAVVDGDAVKKLISGNAFTIIASSDSVTCGNNSGYKNLSGILNKNIFESLQFRQQIIGLVKDGKSDFITGLPEVPLDAFIDTQKYSLISICKAFDDC